MTTGQRIELLGARYLALSRDFYLEAFLFSVGSPSLLSYRCLTGSASVSSYQAAQPESASRGDAPDTVRTLANIPQMKSTKDQRPAESR